MDIESCCQVKTPLDPDAAYQVAIAENPANRSDSAPGRKKRAVGKHARFWAPGRTLRVAFLNGDQEFKEAVKSAVENWQPHINLNLEFVEGTEGDIRIRCQQGVYWSYIGTDALTVTDQSLPTMALATDYQHSKKYFVANATHEFGHVLGAQHEQLNPAANIPWNKPAVYASHWLPEDPDEDTGQDSLTRQTVDDRYFNLLDANEVKNSPYDPRSIMHYVVRQEWTHGDFKVDLNWVLSDKDKAFMAEVYPYPPTESD
ncbi:zinc metalloprotease [Pseudomonas sp. TMB3-21]